MRNSNDFHRMIKIVCFLYIVLIMQACSTSKSSEHVVTNADNDKLTAEYIIGAGDVLKIFVWGNAELSGEIPVRPDGRITTPLVEDMVASGKTPTQLARDMEQKLKRYMKKPVVTVTVTQFVGRFTEQIRVVGEVTKPMTLPYRESITVLDVIIEVGGLTDFAAGNRATIARTVNGKSKKIQVKLDDLLEQGDLSENLHMQPGDVLFVPEAWF